MDVHRRDIAGEPPLGRDRSRASRVRRQGAERIDRDDDIPSAASSPSRMYAEQDVAVDDDVSPSRCGRAQASE